MRGCKESPPKPAQPRGSSETPWPPQPALLGEWDADPCETEAEGRGEPGTRVGRPRSLLALRQPLRVMRAQRVLPGLSALPTRTLSH